MSEASQQTGPFVLKTSVSPWVLERGHTFHHGQQVRQIYRQSKKGNESILMSGLKVSPLSLAQTLDLAIPRAQSEAVVETVLWKTISGLLKEFGEQSWKHG